MPNCKQRANHRTADKKHPSHQKVNDQIKNANVERPQCDTALGQCITLFDLSFETGWVRSQEPNHAQILDVAQVSDEN